jgi:hypothetical protein
MLMKKKEKKRNILSANTILSPYPFHGQINSKLFGIVGDLTAHASFPMLPVLAACLKELPGK